MTTTNEPRPARSPEQLLALLIAFAGSVLPIVLYWLVLGRTPAVTPDAAKQMLAEPGSAAILLDVRTAEEYAVGHVEAARNWPYAQIAAATAEDVPEEYRGKKQTLYLLCESGMLSGMAVRHLQQLGVPGATNVQGGMQAWVASADRPCTTGLCQLRAASGDARALPQRPSPPLEQWVAVLTGFVVKPLYTLVALILVVVLWRQRSPDLAALRWALLCFFVGENFCAANYLVFRDGSVLFEFLHCYGMVLCFGLTTYALFEGLDRRLLKLSDPAGRCAAVGLCQRCIKHADVPCGLQRVFQFAIPALLVVSLMPLCAELVPVSYNTTIFGDFYNYSHPAVYQVFELRYLPVAAAVLLAVSAAVLRFKRREPVRWSKIYFAAGAGAMGFSFFRMIIFHCFRDNLVWFGAWEEITELLFVLGAAIVLWVFRESLFVAHAARVRTSYHESHESHE